MTHRQDSVLNSHAAKTEFFTIGHSNQSLAEFLELLRQAAIDEVVDVRRLPGSRRYPWFDQENLAEALHAAGVAYRHAVDLTGRRPKQDVPDAVNSFWQNRSFHNFADYALSDAFRAGFARLRASDGVRPALMCAEAVWWRCHRRIIADHLLAHDEQVLHVMGLGKITPAELTSGAEVTNDRTVIYPRPAL